MKNKPCKRCEELQQMLDRCLSLKQGEIVICDKDLSDENLNIGFENMRLKAKMAELDEEIRKLKLIGKSR